ncbi:MAG: HAMP domain-containing protein [Burkholderiales bacterium]|nr:HAMP domain-containing protein [Burkholderiales bacterium]MBP6250343.1 HAMP domain-containing protein [Leptothrix sp. (in: b-proteobacteria)]MBP7519664.1 HAMP domain-containing protein [Leptothrix sp. (in: b-proteobacteria)]
MRNLYLRIYLTIIAILTVFALVGGMLVQRLTESERGRFEAASQERAAAWAELLQHSLPPATASVEQQGEALLEWADRLRLPLALDDAAGRRLATSAFYARLEEEAGRAAGPRSSGSPETVAPGSLAPSAAGVRIQLEDGRGLWVGSFKKRLPPRVHAPWDRGPPAGPHNGPKPAGDGPRPPFDAGPPPGGDPGAGWFNRLPRWLDEAGLLILLLGLLFVAVVAGSYPVARRLTRRLEALQRGVEKFGGGQLSHRVKMSGKDEIARLADSFNQAAERIERLVQSNRSLLANASHELRSPLARLKMALAMQDTVADPERRAELQQEMSRNIRELDALVEEVLLASRLDASRERDHEPVDLLGVLAEEAARVGAQVEGEAVELRGDERLLRRALRNLLENARRYGGEEVDARLYRSGRSQGRGEVVVQVCDRGPGVPLEFRERVFEPFFRLPGHAERAGGVGLGLSLVRQIAQQHGGRVSVTAREGGGSCFEIRLPL